MKAVIGVLNWKPRKQMVPIFDFQMMALAAKRNYSTLREAHFNLEYLESSKIVTLTLRQMCLLLCNIVSIVCLILCIEYCIAGHHPDNFILESKCCIRPTVS